MPYIVITEYGVDQICDTLNNAKAEVKDLKRLGFSATTRTAKNWQEAEEMADIYNNDR